MTNETILKKAIEKVVGNGFEISQCAFDYLMYFETFEKENNVLDYFFQQRKYYELIFSHSFAKAYWGEHRVRYYNREFKDISKNDYDHIAEHLRGSEVANRGFKHHLQQMVLEENPLQYLRRFIDEKPIRGVM